MRAARAEAGLGHGAIVSAWPVRQGLAVEGGTLYVTVGVTSPGVYVLALDANDGRLRWRQSLWWAAPCGTLAVGDERIYGPTEPGTGVFQLDRADGKQRRGGIGTQVAYIRGREGDAEELRQGFAVHGGGEVLGLNRQEVRASGWAYDLLPAAGDTEPRLTRMEPPRPPSATNGPSSRSSANRASISSSAAKWSRSTGPTCGR